MFQTKSVARQGGLATDFFLADAVRPCHRRPGTDAGGLLVVHEGGHSLPRTEMVKETLGWLDRYLGEVR